MQVTGNLLVGNTSVRGTDGETFAIAAEAGDRIEPSFGGATKSDLDRTLELAWTAFPLYRATTPQSRAAFLRTIADEIEAIGDALIVRAMTETGLPRGRLEGERGRTVNQLKMFATEIESGAFLDERYDPADPGRKPTARPELRSRRVALGPVAVFGASNFPLAFSVAGGDTASALAAGCPVVVKAHSAHLGTADLVGQAVRNAVIRCGLPDGTFSLLFASNRQVGEALVADDRIRAVGFTGSRAGGVALMKIAAARKQPIPVYAEMSSINPVILFPGALDSRAEDIAQEFVGSLTLGAGQFCTNPGVILAVDGPGLDKFLSAASAHIEDVAAQTMLTGGMARQYAAGSAHLAGHPAVASLGEGKAGHERQGTARLFTTDGQSFLEHADLQEELFGPGGLVVRCSDWTELNLILERLEGQLTVALHVAPSDLERARAMLPKLEDLAGRLLFNGFGTGVELSRAMVHGGPYPSTSDGRTTSVGTMAMERFLRPVSYQNLPAELIEGLFVQPSQA